MVDIFKTSDATPNRISGAVRYSNGTPAVNCSVKAFDFDLIGEPIKLGDGLSNAMGCYDIPYSAAQLNERGKTATDLVVKVFDAEGELLATSPLIPNAGESTVVNLKIDRAGGAEPPEYERLMKAIEPRMRGTSLADLTADNVAYLATVTGQDARKIDRLANSARCARDLSLNNGSPQLPESVVYAWLSQGLPETASELAMQPRTRLVQALERAQAANIVAAPVASEIDRMRVVDAELSRQSTTMLASTGDETVWPHVASSLIWHYRVAVELSPSTSGQPLTTADLLAATTTPVLSDKKLRMVAELRADAGPLRSIDAESLEANGFEPAEVVLTLRLLALADLTMQHLPLVHTLSRLFAIDTTRLDGSLAHLARLHTDEWQSLVKQTGVPKAVEGDTDEAHISNYAATLERTIESSFRTGVVAARIEQNRMALPVKSKPRLNHFFRNHPDFEFGKHQVLAFLDQSEPARLDGIDDLTELKRDLLRLERTIKLTDNHRQQSVLLAKRFDSAQKIARHGQRDFVRQFGAHPEIGQNAAQTIYARAEHTAALAQNLLVRHHETSLNLQAMGSVDARIPDLATLFGSLDGGTFDPCLSAISPAAYLADLMNYLEDRRVDSRTIVAVVSNVDSGAIAAELDQARFPEALRGPLTENTQLPLTAAAAIKVVKPAVEWHIDDHAGELDLFNGSNLSMQLDTQGVPIKVATASLYQDRGQLDRAEVPVSVVNAIPKIEVLKRLDPNQRVNPTLLTAVVVDTGIRWTVNFTYEVKFYQYSIEDGNGDSRYYFGYRASGITNLSETEFSDRLAYESVYNELSSGRLADQIKADLGANWSSIEKTSDDQGGVHWRLSVNYGLNTYFSEFFMALYPTDVSLLSVLLARRPDLMDTEFSCENSQTLLPYVDLTAEILERAAGQPYPRLISVDADELPGIIADLNAGKINPSLANAVEFVPPLHDQARVRVGIVDREWYLTDTGRQCGLRSGLVLSKDGRQPSVLLTSSVRGDVKVLDARGWPASVIGAVKIYRLDSATFGQGYFVANLDSIDSVTQGGKWSASFRYLVIVTKESGGPVSIRVGPEWANFLYLVPYDQEEAVLGPLRNRQVPPSILAELFDEHSNPAVREAYTDESLTVWEIWTDHQLLIDYHPLSIAWDVPQTSQRSQAIAAQPEHVDAKAYAALKFAGYPWALPFDLPSEEARTYLSYLGASRGVLMETFDRSTALPNPELGPLTSANSRSAAIRLGFNTVDLRIISGKQVGTGVEGDPNSGPWNFWGFSTPDLGEANSIPDPANISARISQGQWVKVLTGRVDVFLQQSGLSYDELRELLDMRYINTKGDGQRILDLELGSIPIGSEGDTRSVRSSDLSKARLVWAGISPAEGPGDDPEVVNVLIRLHRFVKLWRIIGWPMRDLDQAAAVAPRPGGAPWPDLDEGFIGSLDRFKLISQAHFHRPENYLSLAATNLYRDYITPGEPLLDCLYDRLFLSTSLGNPPNPAFELNNARNELRNPEASAQSHLPHIAAACGISLQEASLLLQWQGDDPKLTLGTLSSIFWATMIAQNTSVSIKDVLSLLSLQERNGLSSSWRDPQTVVACTEPIELGLKFHATITGQINAVRYWKPSGEVGEHWGHLWDSAGVLLAKVRFQSETAYGWQEQRLATPVRIEKGAVHVVSVNANKLHAFTDNGMVRTQSAWLITEGDGQNGVMGGLGHFPNASVNNPNYHRDVGFIAHYVTAAKITLPEAVHTAGFTVPEVLYLLAHQQSSNDAANEQAKVGQLLGELRATLSAIDLEARLAQEEPDVDSNAMVREMVALGWHPQVIDEVLAAIEAVHAVALVKLAPNVLPDPRLPTVRHEDGHLLSTTVLSSDQRMILLSLSTDQAFTSAASELIALFALSEERVARDLCSFDARDTSVRLEQWPSTLAIPADLTGRMYHDAATAQLHFVGAIDDRAMAQITAIPNLPDECLIAVGALRDGYKTLPPDAEPLLNAVEQAELLSRLTTPTQRYRYLLDRLVPHRVHAESLVAVCNKMSTASGMPSSMVATLLSHWLNSSDTVNGPYAIDDFLAPDFVRSVPSIPVTPDRFALQFKTCIRLSKVATLVRHFQLTDVSLSFLFKPLAPASAWLDPNRLPVATDESSVALRALLRTSNLYRLRDELPSGDSALAQIFAAAHDESMSRKELVQRVHKATDWDLVDMATLLSPNGFNYATDQELRSAFQSEGLLRRLVDCVGVMKRIGANAAQCLAWSDPNLDIDSAGAADIRRLARARHSESAWNTFASPLRDTLREQQRQALVAYLIGREQLRDSGNLYDRYLIDVDMQPSAMTSRIKQACASVQLFVQRCLLNLEPDVRPDKIDTDVWAWMKNYRVWEANRKVFLYPENWIEPELRDDKSEPFRQFESELLQNNMTSESCSDAFSTYAETLSEVARMTIVGMCSEVQERGVKVMHILGRDGASPYRYFYRQWRIPAGSDRGHWSCWQQVNLGINSEHVLIFMFAGRVNIAWPSITAEGADGSLKITMNVARWQPGGWGAPKRGLGSLSWMPPPNIDENRGLAFRVITAPDGAVDIKCYGAALDANKFVSDLKPVELLAWDLADPTTNPIVVINLRNIARYKDHFGRSYHWVADIEVNLMAWFTGLLSTQIPVWNVHPNHGKIEYGGSLRTFFKVPSSFSGAFRSIHLYLSPETRNPKYENVSLMREFDISKTSNFELSGDTIIDILQGQGDLEFAPDRYVHVTKPLGSFRLDTSSMFIARDDDGKNQRSDRSIISAVEDRNSNYREIPFRENPDNGLELQIPFHGTILLNHTPSGQFVVSEAAFDSIEHTSVVAYSDETNDLVFRGVTPMWRFPKFSVMPASGTWEVAFRRELNRGRLISAMGIQNQAGPMLSDIGAGIDAAKSIINLGVTFNSASPFSVYCWESFFHIPILAATQLSKNQRFEEAQHWFHMVFDPTVGDRGTSPSRFWRFQPFIDAGAGESIEQQLLQLAAGDTTLSDQIAAWREQPFRPHAIARTRVRAYQLFVVFKYLDNLMAWADQLFRRDTIESINEATQLYLLASEILGHRPIHVRAGDGAVQVRTFRELPALDHFGNALVALESLLPASAITMPEGRDIATEPSTPHALYFGIPANDELLRYWDTVEARLFNIRHSRNIEGVGRQLALYEPPIDPAVLVRAVAAGIDISSALADLQSPLPLYRFNVVLQKALELANDVKAYGASMLSALEKQDGEALALLRSSQEMGLLKLVQTVRSEQLKEAQANVAALRKTRELVLQRFTQYQRLLGKTSIEAPAEGQLVALEGTPSKAAVSREVGGDVAGLGLTLSEADQLAWMERANGWMWASGSVRSLAGVLHALPDFIAKTPVFDAKTGGSHLGHATGAISDFLGTLGSDASFHSSRAATVAGHQRRHDDWAFQSNLAAKELEQIDKQMVAAELRVSIANQELENQQRQMDNAQEVDAFMHDKFTNAQLYRWMSGQASSVHFRSYQLAYDMAKRAERCYRFELGLEDKDSNFVQFGHWDSLKKGLLAGEMLALDIKRLELAYLDKNRRELEITKHVSLRQLDGAALLNLRANGGCEFELPEELFDLDFSGHYFRRIKSVSISIPCVTGPYTSVSGTLTMLSSKLRTTAVVQQAYADERNYRSTYLPLQSIATSSGQNDSGLFELNFRDERFLPFEGGGAISRWRFTLPKDFHAFDYSTISDLVLHVRYTARDGGESLSASASQSLVDRLNDLSRAQGQGAGLVALVSVRQDFAELWQRAQRQPDVPVSLQLRDELFPFMFRSRVKAHGAVFAWTERDETGTWQVAQTEGELDSPLNSRMPAVVIPPNVAKSVDAPWLIINFTVNI